jgi:hypothetical protein
MWLSLASGSLVRLLERGAEARVIAENDVHSLQATPRPRGRLVAPMASDLSKVEGGPCPSHALSACGRSHLCDDGSEAICRRSFAIRNGQMPLRRCPPSTLSIRGQGCPMGAPACYIFAAPGGQGCVVLMRRRVRAPAIPAVHGIGCLSRVQGLSFPSSSPEMGCQHDRRPTNGLVHAFVRGRSRRTTRGSSDAAADHGGNCEHRASI